MKNAFQILQDMRERMGLSDPPQPESILTEADRLTEVDRGNQYGSFFSEAGKVAFIEQMILSETQNRWSQEEKDTLSLMVRKLVRHGFKKKRDNLVDLAGYAKLLQQLHETADE